MRIMTILICLAAPAALAQDEPATPATEAAAAAPASPSAAAAPAADSVKAMSGMSILGNEEAPKSLVIVPWKSSRLGDEPGVSNALDERARPLDKEVFTRELRYYSLRSGSE